MSILLPKLIREKLKDYESFYRWKDDNQKMIKEFRQKTSFRNNVFEPCNQDESDCLCYINNTTNEFEPLLDLNNDVRHSYHLNYLIYNMVDPSVCVYKSRRHYFSSGCNCSQRLCKDIDDCPSYTC